MKRVTFIAVFLSWAFASVAAAQEKAALIADRIEVLGGNVLKAEGNVEVLFQGSRLKAEAVIFDSNKDKLTFVGPMSLADSEGQAIFIAESGELSDGFQNGVLISARLVLDQQMQIAGNEVRRIDGRYTQMFRAVASSCLVCEKSETPLWQIRASEVVHDEQKKRIYYKNATFEVGGVPVFFAPRLRMPDPSVNRASGFLPPNLKNSSVLGSGVQIPYFQTLGENADLLVTPYISSQTRSLDLQYRHLFKNGALLVDAAISSDSLRDGDLRGYLFGQGTFFLPKNHVLEFNVKTTSDESYLFDYGISDQDRLRSDLGVRRTERQSHFDAQTIAFNSFRDDEDSGSIPASISQIGYLHSLSKNILGGQTNYRFQTYGLTRSSSDDVVGRDYTRISAGLDWKRSEVIGPGLALALIAKVDLDHFTILQDSTAEGGTKATATGAVELAWPLARETSTGAVEVLEPKIQLVHTNAETTGVPNEESTLIEFDEGALWSLDRIPGATQYEIGARLNVGATWTRRDVNGQVLRVTAGKVFRPEDQGQFNEATGLSGQVSDWMIAGRAEINPNLSATGKFLIQDDLSLTRSDLAVRWEKGELDAQAEFLWHIAEPEVGRDLDTWELQVSSGFPLGGNWSGLANLRYDFISDRAASAGLQITYQSRCIEIQTNFDRTFTSSDSVTPRSDYTIALSVPTKAVASGRSSAVCSVR